MNSHSVLVQIYLKVLWQVNHQLNAVLHILFCLHLLYHLLSIGWTNKYDFNLQFLCVCYPHRNSDVVLAPADQNEWRLMELYHLVDIFGTAASASSILCQLVGLWVLAWYSVHVQVTCLLTWYWCKPLSELISMQLLMGTYVLFKRAVFFDTAVTFILEYLASLSCFVVFLSCFKTFLFCKLVE